MDFLLRRGLIAEFRGPGVRRNPEDSGDDYELDIDPRIDGIDRRSGRVILLGDGKEVLTDSDETEMFDHEEEDKDLDSQVARGRLAAETDRGMREETPGPEAPESTNENQASNSMDRIPTDSSTRVPTEIPGSTETTIPTIIPESALPDKLITSPSKQENE